MSLTHYSNLLNNRSAVETNCLFAVLLVITTEMRDLTINPLNNTRHACNGSNLKNEIWEATSFCETKAHIK